MAKQRMRPRRAMGPAVLKPMIPVQRTAQQPQAMRAGVPQGALGWSEPDPTHVRFSRAEFVFSPSDFRSVQSRTLICSQYP